METRSLHADDLELVCRHREEMFREAGRSDTVLSTMTGQFRHWLEPRLRDGSYYGFLLLDDGKPVAGIGLMTIEWPPHPSHPMQDKRGYVLNVYVEQPYRGRGLGRELMKLAEEEFARRDLQFAVLHATELGQPLYAKLGWNPTTEMSKPLAA
ncbi:GNAT family N-acetyltransferase [Burkholderia multivorans]|uniref:GNAT family N-acetyltransferase n=1 Tax=Burkholderia multivorans TaxID=87883 RepID=UPI001C95DA87|nr:GNAT family N-acetyltransferase [Burkholderia multivorans]MBY4673882.1 GNAT family N-acetyltransferase [Burkholderia multivorans]